MELIKPKEPLFRAVVGILEVATKALAGILSFGALAYVVGWITARSYFGGFGAEWLARELPARTVLTYSWSPLLYILFFVWLGLLDLAEGEHSDWSRSFRYRYLRHAKWPLLAALAIVYVLDRYGFVKESWLVGQFVKLAFALYVAAAFEGIVRFVRDDVFVGDAQDASLIYAIVVVGLYFVPSVDGHTRAVADRRRESSDLPLVHVEAEHSDELRLLWLGSDTAFATVLSSDGSPPDRVQLIPRSKVTRILAKPEAISREPVQDDKEASRPDSTVNRSSSDDQ